MKDQHNPPAPLKLKFCTDCRHCIKSPVGDHECALKYVHPVDGKEHKRYCFEARCVEWACGMAGKHWVAKEAVSQGESQLPEGYRWLEPGESLKEGDEYESGYPVSNRNLGRKIDHPKSYRRKIEVTPPLPYGWRWLVPLADRFQAGDYCFDGTPIQAHTYGWIVLVSETWRRKIDPPALTPPEGYRWLEKNEEFHRGDARWSDGSLTPIGAQHFGSLVPRNNTYIRRADGAESAPDREYLGQFRCKCGGGGVILPDGSFQCYHCADREP